MDVTLPSFITSKKSLLPESLKEVRPDSKWIGKIAARYGELSEGGIRIFRIWCELIGNFDESVQGVAQHEFSIGTFPYCTYMDRSTLCVDKLVKHIEESNGDDSAGGDSSAANGEDSGSGEDEDLSIITELMESSVSANTCELCSKKMIPNSRVGALLKTETGRLFCTDRNSDGAYHVYHVPCLIHWILLCETLNFSVICLHCLIDGVIMDEDGKTPDHSEMPKLRRLMKEGAEEWEKSPELLEKESHGLTFVEQGDFLDETVLTLKVLRFFQLKKNKE